MTKIKLLAVGLLLGSVGSVAFAQEGPCTAPRRDLVSPVVRAKVTQGAAQFLMRFAVEAFPVAGTEPIQGSPVGWEGWGAITNSNYYSWTTLQEPRGLAPGTAIVRIPIPEGQAPESCKGSNIIALLLFFNGQYLFERLPAPGGTQ